MPGSVLDALLKAGIVSKEQTPDAKREAEQQRRQSHEEEQLRRKGEDRSAPSRRPQFEAPATAQARISDPAESLRVNDELTQEMKDWFSEGQADLDAQLASGQVKAETIKKLWREDPSSPGFVRPKGKSKI